MKRLIAMSGVLAALLAVAPPATAEPGDAEHFQVAAGSSVISLQRQSWSIGSFEAGALQVLVDGKLWQTVRYWIDPKSGVPVPYPARPGDGYVPLVDLEKRVSAVYVTHVKAPGPNLIAFSPEGVSVLSVPRDQLASLGLDIPKILEPLSNPKPETPSLLDSCSLQLDICKAYCTTEVPSCYLHCFDGLLLCRDEEPAPAFDPTPLFDPHITLEPKPEPLPWQDFKPLDEHCTDLLRCLDSPKPEPCFEIQPWFPNDGRHQYFGLRCIIRF